MTECRSCELEFDNGGDKYVIRCLECRRLYKAKWRESNKDRINSLQKTYRENLSDDKKEENRLKVVKYKKQYYADNADKLRAEVIEYRKANRGKCNHWNALRDNRKTKATPKWLTKDEKEQMKALYEQAAYLTDTTNIEYHVDHIHALKGRDFCGLHVPWNLRVITAIENLQKGNKLENLPDDL